ncbi:hypothetical protein PAEPH01_2000 [Pancytospora epiphaga]|nr:hypothetical protein PAEPH01_2000 [Pancytospora epiphaga]
MYSISHLSHPIPDVSISAISGSKIYYYYDSELYLYRIGEDKAIKLCKVGIVQKIFFIGPVLFVLGGNLLKQYRQTECSVILKETTHLLAVPLKSVVLSNGVVFIYEDSVEIFVKRLYKVETGRHRVVDICNISDTSYVLTNTGEIYACPNIVESLRILYRKHITVVPENTRRYTSIDEINGSIILSNNEYVTKYSIIDNCMIMEYELAYSGRIIERFLCGDETVELEKAPFVCLADRLYSINGSIGVSSTRVYIFERIETGVKNEEVYYEGWVTDSIGGINTGEVIVPKIIEDENLRKEYTKLVGSINRYKALCDSIRPVVERLSVKEAEIESMSMALRGRVEEHKERASKLWKRVVELEERAGRKMMKGDVEEFYKNTEKLQELIEKIKIKDLSKYKHRLMAQRAALKSRIVK